VEAFKLGYEVTEPEELEVEEGDTVICCDILSEGALKAELIDAQVEQLMNLAEKFDVEYDGWGTYFEDPNGEDGDEDDEDYSRRRRRACVTGVSGGGVRHRFFLEWITRRYSPLLNFSSARPSMD
jgi:hypothetical protein